MSTSVSPTDKRVTRSWTLHALARGRLVDGISPRHSQVLAGRQGMTLFAHLGFFPPSL